MINGIFFPQIYLPETEIFAEEELECIFLHELAHYRHGDILFRKLTALAGCVHWFNPIVRKKLYRFVAEYSEAHCDGTVCRKYVNPRLYCSVLLKAAQMRPKKAVSFMAERTRKKKSVDIYRFICADNCSGKYDYICNKLWNCGIP